MGWLVCPYLDGKVELSKEREWHIAERHPDLLPEHKQRILEVLGDPDQVRRSVRTGGARLFARWFPELRGGKHIVVAVLSDTPAGRHWVVTAYLAGRLSGGEVKWTRS